MSPHVRAPHLWVPADFEYPPPDTIGYIAMKHRPTNTVVGPLTPIPISDYPFRNFPHESRTVWRYLDFWKFTDLVRRKLLYFRRSDLLPDKLEGCYAKANETEFTPSWASFQRAHKLKTTPRQMTEAHHAMKERVFLSCWHINELESALMWRSYTESSEAVSIRTTVRTMLRNLSKRVEIARVLYADETEPRNESHSLAPFVYKRPEFERENELRLILQLSPEEDNLSEQHGLNVRIEPRALFHEIIIHPAATKAFTQEARKFISNYLGAIRVSRSVLPH